MVLAIMLIGGIIGGLLAYNKGRMLLFWTLVCGLMPLCLLILLVLPRLPQPGVWRPCPFCLRIIPWQAQVCHVCRREVPPPLSVPCKFCGTTVWAGQKVCSKCGNPAPWKEEEEVKSPPLL
ncbi:MAG: zinc ribbon domain-containing protein [Desulfovibrionaceae bacterium]